MRITQREFYKNMKNRLGFVSIFIVSMPIVIMVSYLAFQGAFTSILEKIGGLLTVTFSLTSWILYNNLEKKHLNSPELAYFIAILPFLISLSITFVLLFEKGLFDLLQVYMNTIPIIILTTFIGFFTIEQAYYNKLMSDFVAIEQEPQIIFYENKSGLWTIYNSGKIGVLLVEVVLLLETKEYLKLSKLKYNFQKENEREYKSLPFILKPNETFQINILNIPKEQNAEEIKKKTKKIIFLGLTKRSIPCIFIFDRIGKHFKLLNWWYNIDKETVREIADFINIPEKILILLLMESNLL